MRQHHVFIEGQSWPGGLESGRFEHFEAETATIGVDALRKALAFDLCEREATEAWGEDFPYVTRPGAVCHVASAASGTVVSIEEIRQFARSVAFGEIPTERFEFNSESDLRVVLQAILDSVTQQSLDDNQTRIPRRFR